MSYYDDTAFTLLCVIVGKKTTSVCDLSDSEPKSIKVDTAWRIHGARCSRIRVRRPALRALLFTAMVLPMVLAWYLRPTG